MSKQKNSALTAGIILGIVSNSILIGFLAIGIILLILASLAVSATGFGAMVGVSATIIIVLYLIFMIAPTVVLILTVRFLKGKSDNKTTVGVLNLVFAVLIGILIAIFSSTLGIVFGVIVILLGLIGGILILTGK